MEELRKIKKLYGEKMSHFCRENFPTILEKKGLLLKILTDNFNPSRALYETLVFHTELKDKDYLKDFKEYIISKTEKQEKMATTTKTPKELLAEVGYELFECKTNEDVQKFKKYYAPGEELCTFNSDRTEKFHVFFAVRKDAMSIKRDEIPKRDEGYGISVISIQFTKDNLCMLSIKNRYNHTVDDCDATFSNDLDNIIPGLTDSFEKYYGMIQVIKQGQFELPSYVKAKDGKFYKYNQEINNIYYCEDNVIIDNYEVKRLDKSRYLLVGCFILDLSTKEFNIYDVYVDDSFARETKDIIKIELERNDKIKLIKLLHKNGAYTNITISSTGSIKSLESNYYKNIGNSFLASSSSIEKVKIYNTESIGNNFLYKAISIDELVCDDVIEVGNSFLFSAKYLNNDIKFSKVKIIGDNFCTQVKYAKAIDFPELELIGDQFFSGNNYVDSINLPKVQRIGNMCFYDNRNITHISMPEVLFVGDGFFQLNGVIKSIDMPKLKVVGDYFLDYADIESITLNNLKRVGIRFLSNNKNLEFASFDSLEYIDTSFLLENKKMKKIYLPNVTTIMGFFLDRNEIIDEVYLPNVDFIHAYFMANNQSIKKIHLPKLKKVKDGFLMRNEIIEEFIAPELSEIELKFLFYANNLIELKVAEEMAPVSMISMNQVIERNNLEYYGEGIYRRMVLEESHSRR